MNNFFAELKRRNVVRVGIAYAVVAWVIMQFLDVVAPLMGLPEVFQKGVLVLLAVGAPIALLLSWAYEVTPEGVMKTAEVDKSKSITHGTGQKINKLINAGLVLVVAFFVYDKFFAATPINLGSGEREASIAVLPFVDLSPAGDQEYFGDGIAEEILNVLAKIPDMKVAGRTSSFQFKGQNPDLRLIGEQLNVDHVLEGSIRKDGNRIRITVQLIAADDGFHLWSETYDRDLVDVFAIQDQISEAVAEALQIHLGTGEEIVVKQETDSPEAYSLYLRGRQLLHSRRPDSIADSIKLFEAATVLDPDFTLAYSAMARSYGLWPLYALKNQDFSLFYEKGKAAARRALELDPKNAEAYSTLNLINLGSYEWQEAEINNAMVLALEPNDAENANFAGDHYRVTFDTINSIKWEGRAYQLDPLHEVNARDITIAYLEAGDFENAYKFAKIAVDLSPRAFSYQGLVYSLAGLGRLEEAREILSEMQSHDEYNPFIVADTEVYLLVREGAVDEARANLEVMAKMVEEGNGDPSFIFQHYLDLGDIEAGVTWFVRAAEEKSPYVASPGFILPENYTDDPELLKRFNHPAVKELFDIRRANVAKNAEGGDE